MINENIVLSESLPLHKPAIDQFHTTFEPFSKLSIEARFMVWDLITPSYNRVIPFGHVYE